MTGPGGPENDPSRVPPMAAVAIRVDDQTLYFCPYLHLPDGLATAPQASGAIGGGISRARVPPRRRSPCGPRGRRVSDPPSQSTARWNRSPGEAPPSLILVGDVGSASLRTARYQRRRAEGKPREAPSPFPLRLRA
jgi:hypothetical protein